MHCCMQHVHDTKRGGGVFDIEMLLLRHDTSQLPVFIFRRCRDIYVCRYRFDDGRLVTLGTKYRQSVSTC